MASMPACFALAQCRCMLGYGSEVLGKGAKVLAAMPKAKGKKCKDSAGSVG